MPKDLRNGIFKRVPKQHNEQIAIFSDFDGFINIARSKAIDVLATKCFYNL